MKKFLNLMLVIAMVLGIVGNISVYADGNKREVNLEQAGSCVYLGNNEKINKNIELSYEMENEIKKSFTDLDIDKNTQKKLIEKIKNGKILDCQDPVQLKKIPSNYFNASLRNPVKRYVFPDGSVIEQKLDFSEAKIEFIKDNSIKTRDLEGGNSSSGTGYYHMSGVKVSKKSGLMGMGFYADYTYHNGAYDRIDSCYNYWVKVALGSHSVESFSIIKKDEDANGPAKAMLKISVYYPLGSGVDWLYLNVGNEKAWTDEN